MKVNFNKANKSRNVSFESYAKYRQELDNSTLFEENTKSNTTSKNENKTAFSYSNEIFSIISSKFQNNITSKKSNKNNSDFRNQILDNLLKKFQSKIDSKITNVEEYKVKKSKVEEQTKTEEVKTEEQLKTEESKTDKSDESKTEPTNQSTTCEFGSKEFASKISGFDVNDMEWTVYDDQGRISSFGNYDHKFYEITYHDDESVFLINHKWNGSCYVDEGYNFDKDGNMITENENLSQTEVKSLTEKYAKEYQEKVSNRTMDFVYYASDNTCVTEDFTYATLSGNANYIGEYRVTDSNGKIVVPTKNDIPKDADSSNYVIDTNLSNKDYFQSGLRNGTLSLQRQESKTVENEDGSISDILQWNDVDWQDVSAINDRLYTEDDAKAECEYEINAGKLREQYPEYFKSAIDDISTQANQEKKSLAEQYAKEYQAKMENKAIDLSWQCDNGNTTITEDFSYYSLKSDEYLLGECRIIDKNGKIVVSSTSEIPTGADKTQYVVTPDVKNTRYFQNAILDGTLSLQEKVDDNWTNKDWHNISCLSERLYTEDDATATVTYETQMDALNLKYNCFEDATTT